MLIYYNLLRGFLHRKDGNSIIIEGGQNEYGRKKIKKCNEILYFSYTAKIQNKKWME